MVPSRVALTDFPPVVAVRLRFLRCLLLLFRVIMVSVKDIVALDYEQLRVNDCRLLTVTLVVCNVMRVTNLVHMGSFTTRWVGGVGLTEGSRNATRRQQHAIRDANVAQLPSLFCFPVHGEAFQR